jgi:uncharacterized membrane protein
MHICVLIEVVGLHMCVYKSEYVCVLWTSVLHCFIFKRKKSHFTRSFVRIKIVEVFINYAYPCG